MFERLLIANRGEIACRIIESARGLGVRAIAVYSEADAEARHVRLADEAWAIGPAPAGESYLCGDVIIETARRAGAGAIHPGYGFLSENADFAAACAVAGIAFVGPPPEAIRLAGEKHAARRAMAEAGLPVVPGYDGESRDLRQLATQARLLGYPILVKATAGGGGRGIRRVERETDLAEAIAAARSEARGAFGDDRVLLEKAVSPARHVEVQIFRDAHGSAVHLFERECSIQRRYQKLIEEAPSPAATPELRAALGEAAVRAAEAIGYVGAGTVEFLLDRAGKFHFMEINARLQVEHPVTETIVGIDLVAWQLQTAAGERLPLTQDEISFSGHAVEARLCAEDPARGFMPAAGRIGRLRFPPAGGPAPVRVDTGVSEGDVVTAHYDSLLAKIVVWGADRAAAVRRLAWALSEIELAGPPSNLGYLSAVAAHPDFVSGAYDTGFAARRGGDLLPAREAAPQPALALAALFVLLDRRRRAAAERPASPWTAADGWRLNDDARDEIRLLDGETPVSVGVRETAAGMTLLLPNGEEAKASGALEGADRLRARIGGTALAAGVARRADARGRTLLTVTTSRFSREFALDDPFAGAEEADDAGGGAVAPMPGRIVRAMCRDGERVARGAPLLALEAMKMEHIVSAPADGRVVRLRCAVGEWVDEGSELVEFAPDA